MMTVVMTAAMTWTLNLHLCRRHQGLKEGGGGWGEGGGGQGGKRGIILGVQLLWMALTGVSLYIYTCCV